MVRSRARAAGAAHRGALVAVSDPASEPSRAERELAELLARLAGLEAETAGLSESLARFRDERRARLGAAEEELFAAKRLEARLVRLNAEAEEWALGESPGEPPARRRKAPRPGLPPASPGVSECDPAPWLSLKELYRMLARKLHPDFANTDAERARRSELMARVNAAYAREDRVLLELVHGEVDSGPAAGEPSPEVRASHAERRLATIAPMVSSLERGLARLRASSLFKDLTAAQGASERGRDYFAEAAYAARRSARESRRAALVLAARLDETLRLYRARSVAPPAPASAPRRTNAGWAVEHLSRPASRSPRAESVTEESRRVAHRLGSAAAAQKWQVVLSLFALFGEASAEPPPALSTFESAAARYELLRAEFSPAPSFERAITELPPHLEIGLRVYPKRLAFGIQAKRPEHLAGIRLALKERAVAPLARAVLSVMGPEERCAECGRSRFLVHVFRARGVDEVHALACPVCGALHQSYRSFGSPVGVEALAPYAVTLGLVVERTVAVGKSAVVLGLLPNEEQGLNAQFLVDRFATLFLDELSPELRDYARLAAVGKPLAPPARIPRGKRVRLTLSPGAPLSMKELERELLTRARSRFRVRSQGGRGLRGS
ncbi:MAG TPA: hypothetical protein VHC69_35675 [Polyangiaceae bacterium]|nr:hypothetical protein [Polyangiaceae bacterium]